MRAPCPRGGIFVDAQDARARFALRTLHLLQCGFAQRICRMYSATIGTSRYVFPDLKSLLAKASPLRSGDVLAGIAATSGEERVAAQYALADLPLATFLAEHVVPYESDEVTRLIVDTHDRAAFAAIAHLTVGGLRAWLLSGASTSGTLAPPAGGLTPEMA